MPFSLHPILLLTVLILSSRCIFSYTLASLSSNLDQPSLRQNKNSTSPTLPTSQFSSIGSNRDPSFATQSIPLEQDVSPEQDEKDPEKTIFDDIRLISAWFQNSVSPPTVTITYSIGFPEDPLVGSSPTDIGIEIFGYNAVEVEEEKQFYYSFPTSPAMMISLIPDFSFPGLSPSLDSDTVRTRHHIVPILREKVEAQGQNDQDGEQDQTSQDVQDPDQNQPKSYSPPIHLAGGFHEVINNRTRAEEINLKVSPQILKITIPLSDWAFGADVPAQPPNDQFVSINLAIETAVGVKSITLRPKIEITAETGDGSVSIESRSPYNPYIIQSKVPTMQALISKAHFDYGFAFSQDNLAKMTEAQPCSAKYQRPECYPERRWDPVREEFYDEIVCRDVDYQIDSLVGSAVTTQHKTTITFTQTAYLPPTFGYPIEWFCRDLGPSSQSPITLIDWRYDAKNVLEFSTLSFPWNSFLIESEPEPEPQDPESALRVTGTKPLFQASGSGGTSQEDEVRDEIAEKVIANNWDTFRRNFLGGWEKLPAFNRVQVWSVPLMELGAMVQDSEGKEEEGQRRSQNGLSSFSFPTPFLQPLATESYAGTFIIRPSLPFPYVPPDDKKKKGSRDWMFPVIFTSAFIGSVLFIVGLTCFVSCVSSGRVCGPEGCCCKGDRNNKKTSPENLEVFVPIEPSEPKPSSPETGGVDDTRIYMTLTPAALVAGKEAKKKEIKKKEEEKMKENQKEIELSFNPAHRAEDDKPLNYNPGVFHSGGCKSKAQYDYYEDLSVNHPKGNPYHYPGPLIASKSQDPEAFR